jgi:hypothetical protein
VLSRISVILLIFIISILFFACEDEPSEIGIELIASELIRVRTFDSQTDTLDQNSSYHKNVIQLGASSKILVGIHEDIEVSSLLKFIFLLADTLKDDIIAGDVDVNEAWIELTTRYVYVDSNEVMDFTVHKVNNFWDSFGFTIDSLPKLSYELNDISSNKQITDTNYVFNIDPAVVLSWMKNAADTSLEKNYGIYLKPVDNSGKVVGFQALTATSSQAAKLTLVIEKTGSYVDTINGFIFDDVSVVDGDLPLLPPEDIAVQSSISVNSIIAFDLSAVPEGVVINSAELTIQRDSINTLTGSSFTNSLKAFFVEDSTAKEVDEGGSFTLSLKDNSYSGDITSYVRIWINEMRNQGLLLRSGNDIEGLELFALKGSTAVSHAEKPRLKIVYTVKENQ